MNVKAKTGYVLSLNPDARKILSPISHHKNPHPTSPKCGHKTYSSASSSSSSNYDECLILTSKKLSSKKSLSFSSVLVRGISPDDSHPIGETTSIFIFHFREIGWTFTTTSYSALTWGIPVSFLLIFLFVFVCRTR